MCVYTKVNIARNTESAPGKNSVWKIDKMSALGRQSQDFLLKHMNKNWQQHEINRK